MRYPTPLKRTARELQMPCKQITQALSAAGFIHRDPHTDHWRASPKGTAEGVVIEQTRAFHHPHLGTCLYPKVKVTAEGRRWLKQQADQAA